MESATAAGSIQLNGRRYRLVERACAVCGSPKRRLLGRRGAGAHKGAAADDAHAVTWIVRCRSCGFLYPFPTPVPDAESFQQEYHNPEDYFHQSSDQRLQHHASRIISLERFVPRRGAILDVGCGTGELLKVARDRGWRVEGIEPSREFAEVARRLTDAPIHVGFFEDAPLEPESFDAVWMAGVLEHVVDPKVVCERLRWILRPGGVAFIEVPNEDGLVFQAGNWYLKLRGQKWVTNLSPMFEPFHISGFGPRSFRVLCRKTGFEIVRLDIVRGATDDFPHQATWADRLEKQFRSLMIHVGALIGRGKYLEAWIRKPA